jgi:hypothetical protein
MIEAWWPTKSSTIAACLGALGIPIRTDLVFDERSGEDIATYYMGLRSLWNNSATEQLLSQWKKGKLGQTDPTHPFLCGVQAAHNAVMVERLLRNGTHLRLAAAPGGCATIYEEGAELQSLVDSDELIETTDRSLVEAFGVIGIPVVAIEGNAFRLPRHGHILKRQFTNEWDRYDAQVLLGKLRDGTLERDEPHHPLVSAYNARLVEAQLSRHMEGTPRRVLLRKPRSIRAAFVSEHAKPVMLDRVARHFRIP